jgi:hypothetical protein
MLRQKEIIATEDRGLIHTSTMNFLATSECPFGIFLPKHLTLQCRNILIKMYNNILID